MTTWRFMTPLWLLVFLSTVGLSEEGCSDDLNMTKWKDNVTDAVPLIESKGPEQSSKQAVVDMLRCTMARAVKDGRSTDDFTYIIKDCLGTADSTSKISENCQENSNKSIAVFHVICLTAKYVNITLQSVCDFGTTCELYSKLEARTTTTIQPSTTTLQERTTAAPTTTILPSTTTLQETTTILQETTTAPPTTTILPSTTTLQETTTTLSPTTTLQGRATTTLPSATVGLTPVSMATGQNSSHTSESSAQGSHSHLEDNNKVLILTTCLIISVILNVVTLLALYLPRGKQWSQDCAKFYDSNTGDDGAKDLPETEPMKKEEADTSMASVDRN